MGVIITESTTESHLHSDTWAHDPQPMRQPTLKHLSKDYIIRARYAEIQRHTHSMNQLQRKMKRLSHELAWELEQHRAKINELVRLEKPMKRHLKVESERIEMDHRSVFFPENSPTVDLRLVEELPREAVA